MEKLINEEQLLSFIDGELSKDEQKKIEEKIHSGSLIQKEYELLLKTKLEPSEIIAYPNKEELYKRTRKVVPFSSWLRAAAVFILIAAGFIIYEKRNGTGSQPGIAITNPPSNKNTKPETTVPTQDNKSIIAPENVKKEDNHLAILPDNSTKKKAKQENTISNPLNTKELVVKNNLPKDPVVLVNNTPKEKIETTTSTALIAYVPATQTINKSPVTSALSQRTISSSVPKSDPDPGTTVATQSDRKGSFKSLLRKAARVIEKKTGIDPANDNDELLIGAVAVKLN